MLCLGTQLCPTLCDPMDCSPPGSSVHGDSPGRNTGVGSLSLLQGIFPTQGSNPGLPHWRQILHCLSLQESPRILQWVVYPFCRGVFPTQESNQGLLHCRWILYQLSQQGSPQCWLVSAIQRESAIKYTYVASLLQLPPTSSHPSSCHRVLGWTPCVMQQLPTSRLVVCVSGLLSQFLPPFPCPAVSTMSASLLLPGK